MSEISNWTGKVSMEFTLARVLEYYFVALELEGKSPKTIDWYRQQIVELVSTAVTVGSSPTFVSLNLKMSLHSYFILGNNDAHPVGQLLLDK